MTETDKPIILEEAFQLIFKAYNSDRLRFQDDHEYIVYLRDKVTSVFTLLQAICRQNSLAAATVKAKPEYKFDAATASRVAAETLLAGGNPDELIGPSHDELLMQAKKT